MIIAQPHFLAFITNKSLFSKMQIILYYFPLSLQILETIYQVKSHFSCHHRNRYFILDYSQRFCYYFRILNVMQLKCATCSGFRAVNKILKHQQQVNLETPDSSESMNYTKGLSSFTQRTMAQLIINNELRFCCCFSASLPL